MRTRALAKISNATEALAVVESLVFRPLDLESNFANMLKVGQRAPAFSVPSTSGKTVSLGDFAGKKVVLYFYPRDNTPGCTVEACDFRDNHAAAKKAGAIVLGVSSDSLASHAKFRTKFELPFDLLVDADNALAKSYGAFGEKSMYGRKYMGVVRSTFLVDERGAIAAIWSPVKIKGHAEEVLAAIRGETTDSKPSAKAAPKKSKAPAANKRAAKN